MLEFSNTVKELIASGSAEVIYLLRIRNSDKSRFMATATHYADVTMEDGTVFAADDELLAVDSPAISTVVDRAQYKITLLDATDRLKLIGSNGLVGKPVDAYLVFLKNGVPLPKWSDAICVYKGKAEGLSGVYDTAEIGEKSVVLTCASPMMALDMSKGFYLSRDYVRARTPDDSCMDEIYDGSGALTMKWGRS